MLFNCHENSHNAKKNNKKIPYAKYFLILPSDFKLKCLDTFFLHYNHDNFGKIV